jgi:retinol dehydrogenase 12
MLMQGKVCLITGATNGHGLATARQLARQGAAVVLLGRSAERCRRVQAQIASECGLTPRLLVCDLSRRVEIDRVAEEFLSWGLPLHVLVNNAGVVNRTWQASPDGVEQTFAVNYLAYFQLTLRLLARLQQSTPARILNVSSDTHRIVSLHLEDLEHRRRRYTFMGAYGRSKLAIVVFTRELARRLVGTGVTVNALDPGPVDSGLALNNGGLAADALTLIMKYFFPSAERACRTAVYLASSPEVEGVTGAYYKWSKPQTPRITPRDPELGEKLWEISERMTGAKFEKLSGC